MSRAARGPTGAAAAAAALALAAATALAPGCRCRWGATDSGAGDSGADARADAADSGPPGTCALPVGADREARVIAVGLKQLLSDAESYATFDAAIGAVFDQIVAPCLSPGVPTLVVFPEDTLLVAAFIGSRGASARAEPEALLAYLQLHGAYASAVARYDVLYPGLSLNQQVGLVVTDTLWRVLTGTFAALAARHGVWLAVTGNVADAVESSDPADLAALADPDLAPPPPAVWVAAAPEVYNQTFFFGPDGAEIARRRKVYLVPDEIALLQLAFGSPVDLAPVDLGFARVGVAISKDAWMPDVLDRLAMAGATIVIQPEAFSGWTIPETPGDWSPDVLMESAWNHVQKFPEIRFGAMAALSGNYFELVFDGQSHVIDDGAGLAPAPPGEGTLGAYVGNDPVPGMRDVGAWAIPDPGLADPALTLQERRDLLRAWGESLVPGAGPPNENAYVASRAAADLWLPPDHIFPAEEPDAVGALALGPSHTVQDWTSGVQAHPAVAAGAGDTSFVVWEDDRTGAWRVKFSRSDDAALTWTVWTDVAPAGPGGGAQQLPAIAATPSAIHVAWQEWIAADDVRVWTARSLDGGASWEAPVALAPAPGGPGGPAYAPAIAADEASGTVVVAFAAVDSTPDPRTRIWAAISTDGGATFAAAPVDASAPAVDERNRWNQWAPAVALAPGGAELTVAWTDFRDYSWDVYAARSTDLGASWEPALRVDDAGSGAERLHDDAALAAGPAGEIFAAWTDLRGRAPVYGVRGTRIDGLGAPAPASAPLGDAALSRWLPAVAFAPDGRLLAAWQDFRDGSNDAYLSVSLDGGASFGPALRLDDVGVAPAHAFRPRLAVSDTGVVTAVWLDTRANLPRVRAAAGPVP